MYIGKRERIAIEISSCGMHGDICCLADEVLFEKIYDWITQFGHDGTYDLIKLACACKPKPPPPVEPPTPPPPPPPEPPTAPPLPPPPQVCGALPAAPTEY